MSGRNFAVAEAPASVGNAAVGFDILGHALSGPHDRVRVQRIDEPTVRIDACSGLPITLPTDPADNAATAPLLAIRNALSLPYGFAVELVKGIPLGSGMGGSAASAVAAVKAAGALLDEPLSDDELLRFALEGERVASGSEHADNAAPSLHGGLVLLLPGTPLRTVRLPVPETLRCVLVHPQFELETRRSRQVLSKQYDLPTVVAQCSRLATVIAGCCMAQPGLLRGALQDLLVEPQRASMIPGFAAVQEAALAAGAIGCSISGGGPSVFAWCLAGEETAIAAGMQQAFETHGLASDSVISPVDVPGARIVEQG